MLKNYHVIGHKLEVCPALSEQNVWPVTTGINYRSSRGLQHLGSNHSLFYEKMHLHVVKLNFCNKSYAESVLGKLAQKAEGSKATLTSTKGKTPSRVGTAATSLRHGSWT